VWGGRALTENLTLYYQPLHLTSFISLCYCFYFICTLMLINTTWLDLTWLDYSIQLHSQHCTTTTSIIICFIMLPYILFELLTKQYLAEGRNWLITNQVYGSFDECSHEARTGSSNVIPHSTQPRIRVTSVGQQWLKLHQHSNNLL